MVRQDSPVEILKNIDLNTGGNSKNFFADPRAVEYGEFTFSKNERLALGSWFGHQGYKGRSYDNNCNDSLFKVSLEVLEPELFLFDYNGDFSIVTESHQDFNDIKHFTIVRTEYGHLLYVGDTKLEAFVPHEGDVFEVSYDTETLNLKKYEENMIFYKEGYFVVDDYMRY